MKITKFVHSCLLIENNGHVTLVDPGQFSWESGTFNIDLIEQIDDIVITHEHADHMHMPFIEVVMTKFPQVRITTNPSVKQQLLEAGIVNVATESSDTIELLETAHASLSPLGEAPQHIGVHIDSTITHPGDSHDFAETRHVLALPITAPWGSVVRAAELALQLGPKYIIPIHDWHWKSEALLPMYDRLEELFAKQSITFIKPIDGKPFEV